MQMSPNSRRLVVGAVSMLGLWVLGACGQPRSTTLACRDSSQCDAGEYCDRGLCKPLSGQPSSFCSRDTECQPHEFCNGGACEERPATPGPDPDNACATHADCSFGLFCKLATNTCVGCLNDDHCDSGQVCTSAGTCGDERAGCTSNLDCAGLRCDIASGECVQCVSSGDCPNGQSCRNQQCVNTQPDPVSCDHSGDCAAGKICDGFASVCRDCQNDNECGVGMRCAAGTCTTAQVDGGSCWFRDECPNAQACVLGECSACVFDFDCFDPFDIITGSTYICQSGRCTEGECDTAIDCPAGQACYSNRCGECWYDEECRVGERCNVTTGACEAIQTPTPTPGNRAFGQSCSSNSECATDLTCIEGSTGVRICTRPCIGSGKGGNEDCPSGYACFDFDDGGLDGAKMCLSAAQVPASYPGQGFTQLPGAACSASNNQCQTSACFTDVNSCARSCSANRDCGAGEVCYAEWSEYGTTGGHYCYESDLTNYLPVGAVCSEGWECDSGLCGGTCSDGSYCNSSEDCATGSCTGVCVDHCRSNADCASTDACTPFPTYYTSSSGSAGYVPVCMEKFFNGTQNDGTSCTSHSQCKSDWCVGNICTSPCGTTADCTGGLSGKSCVLRTFVQGSTPIFSMTFCQ